MKKMLSLLIALAMVLSMVPAAFAAEATTAITVQPSSVTAAEGSNAQFLVVVDGEVASYQWQYDMGEGWTNTNNTGYNTDTLTVVAQTHRQGYQYRCVITDANGSEIISDVATLTIGEAAAAEITVQPNSMLAAAGTNAQFEVVAEGDVASYQWQRLNGSAWSNVTNNGNATSLLTIPAETHRNGYIYRCVITDVNGVQIISNMAVLTIGNATARIVVNNQSQVVAEGSNAKFTVVASGEVASYQWQFNDGYGWSNTSNTGYNTPALTVKADAHRNGYRYRCLVTDSNGNQIISSVGTLTISDVVATVTVQPSSVTAAEGANAQFLALVDGDVASYQWQYYDGYGWYDTSNTGYNTNMLTVAAQTHRQGYQYRCIITDTNGNEILSDVAILTIGEAAAAEITVQPNSMLAAAGTNAQFEVVAEGDVASYQWQRLTDTGWSNVTNNGNTTSLLTIPAESHRNGYTYRCVITDTNGVQIISNVAVLTIGDATAKIVINNQNQVAAEGGNANFTVIASGAVASYQWQFSDGFGWYNTSNTGYNTPVLTVTADAYRNGYRYRCLVTDSNGNQIISSVGVLTISDVVATITAQPSNATAPVGSNAQFSVDVDGNVASYQWQYYDGYGWYNTDKLEGYDTATVTVEALDYRNNFQYRCVITDANGNEILSDVAVLKVGEAENAIVITAQPVDKTVAVGETAEFEVIADGEMLTYRWKIRNDPSDEWGAFAADNGSGETFALSFDITELNYEYYDGAQFYCLITDMWGNELASDIVTLTIETEPELGSAENPIDLTEDLLYQDDFSATVTVPAGKTYHYIAYKVGGMIMSINGGEGVTCVTDSMWNPYAWTITNDGEADAEYVITVSYPVGTAENPETIWDLSEINVAIAEGNNQGYYYSFYNRAATGTISLSVASATEGVEYNVILTNTVSGDMAWLSDSVDGTVQMAVVPNDFVTIQVAVSPDAEWNYPAADIVLNGEFIYPVGSMENPAIIEDITSFEATQAEGDNDGYWMKWTAPEAGILKISANGDFTQDFDLTVTHGNAQKNLAYDADDFGQLTFNVAEGDELIFTAAVLCEYVYNEDTWDFEYDEAGNKVVKTQYPAGTVYVNGQYQTGSEDHPYTISVDDVPGTTTTPNSVAAASSDFYMIQGGGVIMTVAAENTVINYNGVAYAPVDGVITIQLAELNFWAGITSNVIEIVNNGTEAAAYELSFAYPAGIMENPAELVIGENTATIAAGSQGYYYTWTAEKDGTLTITMPAGDWTYTINNLTAGAYGDTQWSDSDPVVNVAEIAVSAGDEIQIIVNTYDPEDMWNNPDGNIVVNASFEADVVIEEDVTNPDDGEE